MTKQELKEELKQAVQFNGAQKVSPQQMQQMLGAMSAPNMQNAATPVVIPVGMVQVPVQKPSLMQKLRGIFR